MTKRLRKWGLTLLVVGLIIGAWAFGLPEYLEADRLQQQMESLGPWSAPGFVAIVLIGLLLALPSAPLMFAGGFLFGPAVGFGLTWIALVTGGGATYWIARTVGRDVLEPRLPAKLKALDERLETHGFRIMLLLRLTPIVPYSGLNYGSGLTRIRFRDYLMASAVGMIPGIAAYSLLGHWTAHGWPF